MFVDRYKGQNYGFRERQFVHWLKERQPLPGRFNRLTSSLECRCVRWPWWKLRLARYTGFVSCSSENDS